MSGVSSSPRRRHILSSINPQTPGHNEVRDAPRTKHRGRSRAESPPYASDDKPGCHDEKLRPRSTRFRIKKRNHQGNHKTNAASSSHHSRGKRSSHCSAGPGSPGCVPEPAPLDPESAFRESLFDAMADDEGAAYWEHVYGQPIHMYPKERIGPTGELERMTDDEYAAYVLRKMYEKTHAGLIEERTRRKAAQLRKEEERRQRHQKQREEEARLRAEMEASLRNGARDRHKQWAQQWSEYAQAWLVWDGNVATLPWPVKRRKAGRVAEGEVRAFFRNGLGLDGLEEDDLGRDNLMARLKQERVRWHPDKMQQRLGGQVDQAVMRDITAIFQLVDALWDEARTAKR
ncbi:hypothetical protein CDD82_571 [Ophiocordyceps australis]|uniref:J domain-containing protein n=1 Tax=Ophiocordyceps australis TaxID=1399860 RepID=A0A2C5XR79_9HYPO|nr:hypothetical protein CDD82_571 [Ophiocordyceps australis]